MRRGSGDDIDDPAVRAPPAAGYSYRCVSCNTPAAALSNSLGPKDYALATCVRRHRRRASFSASLAASVTLDLGPHPHSQARCAAFVDPYIEHGTELLLVDLFLVKTSVYRHLLRNADTGKSTKSFLKLAIIVFIAETYLTWSRQELQVTWDAPSDFFVDSLAAQLASTLLLHVAAFLLCRMYAQLARSTKPRLRTVSQALFLASTTKLFFLSLGLIWRSLKGAEGAAPIIGLSMDDLILQTIEFASRTVALSAAIDCSLIAGGLVALLLGILPFITGLATAKQ